MSCYDWDRLAAHRFETAEDATEPASWAEAVAHLPGCAACRAAALAADPSLLFVAARPAPAPAAAEEAAEIAAMQDAVAALRRGRRVEARAERAEGDGWRPWRTAAAAGLAVAALSLAPSGPPRLAPQAPVAPETGAPEIPRTVEVAPGVFPLDPAELGGGDDGSPIVEGLDRPDARLYQLGTETMQVVMIVDEDFDV